VLEWRLLGPALRSVLAAGLQLVVVGPPRQPHLPGLRHAGIDARQLIWIQAETPAERLWCTEQLIKSDACGALLAWLPQARPEQIRRLQVCAQACQGPVFLLRPAASRHQASAAPLRVLAGIAPDWSLRIEVLKRRGPVHEGELHLQAIPGGLEGVLTPRLRRPSGLHVATPAEVSRAVGGPVAAAQSRRHAGAH
jgi:protein ImuA